MYGSALRLFPNPATGALFIDLSVAAAPGTVLRLTGITGQEALRQPAAADSKRQVLDLSQLPTGLYFLHVLVDGKILAVEKVVKQ